MVKISKFTLFVLGIFLLQLPLVLGAVNFHTEIPTEGSIRVGDTFEIRVLLDIPAAENIKHARFTLTPNNENADLTGATSGALLVPVTPILNGPSGSGWRFEESTTGTEVSGTDRLFATMMATATAAGDVTFNFIGLLAERNSFNIRSTSSAPKTITILAAATNNPPVLAPIGPKTVTVGETLTFTVSATDVDGDALTFSADDIGDATFNPATRMFSWAPTEGDIGSNDAYSFTVSDGTSLDAEGITITVLEAASDSCTLADWSVGDWSTCTNSAGLTCRTSGGTTGTVGVQSRTVTLTGTCIGGVGSPITRQLCDVPSCAPLATVCGNEVVEAPEQCDGSNLGENTCITVPGGFTSGILSCASDCTFDLSQCTSEAVAQGVGLGNACAANADCAVGECIDSTCRDVDGILSQIGTIIRDGNFNLIRKISGIARVLQTFFA